MKCNCEIYLGKDNKIKITNQYIDAVAAVESIHGLPSGRVILRTPNKAIDSILGMPSNIPIHIAMSSFLSQDGSDIQDENTFEIKGTVVKHYTDTSNSGSTTYVLEFINAGEDLKYLSLLKSRAISNTSIGSIQKICKELGVTFKLDSGSIVTNDYMKWLVVNKNFILSLDQLLNKSYINDKDAIYMAYKLNNTIRLGSLQNSFNNPKKITYIYSRGAVDIVNSLVDFDTFKLLKYYGNNIKNTGGIQSATTQSGVVTAKVPVSGKATGPQQVAVTSDSSSEGKTGTLPSPITSTDIVVKKHPNTHKYYGMAPKIRDSVFGRYSNKIEIYASGESEVEVGDVIDIAVPVIGSSDSIQGVNYSTTLSGKYFVSSKQYHYGNNDRFEVKIELIRDYNNKPVNKDYLTNFGISEDSIK